MNIFLVSFSFCVVLILFLGKLAHHLKFYDYPGGRKTHRHPIPTIGGLAMYISVATAMAAFSDMNRYFVVLLGISATLVILGVLDDRRELSASFRMMIQVFFVSVVVVRAGGTVSHLGELFGGDFDILLGMFSVPFSVVAFVGGINAINMIDGADGMAGTMALITTLGVLIIFTIAGATTLLPFAYAMIGALIAFMIFNSRIFVKRALVFMGDAGSMWIGLVLGWFMAHVIQGVILAEPPLVLWLFGIPLVDTLVVMTRRMKRNISPFVADRTHIHHVFEHAGFSVRSTVLILGFVQLVLVGIGVIFYIIHAPAYVVFWSFILLLSLYYYWLRNYQESKYARLSG